MKEKLTKEEKRKNKLLEKQQIKETLTYNKEKIENLKKENIELDKQINVLREEDKQKKLERLNEELKNCQTEEEKKKIEKEIKLYISNKFKDPIKSRKFVRQKDANLKEIELLKKANLKISPWGFWRNVLILTIIALFMGLLIGVTNHFTAPVIKRNERKQIEKAYKLIYKDEGVIFKPANNLDGFDKLTKEEQTKIKDLELAFSKDNKLLGILYTKEKKNNYGLIKFTIGINTDGTSQGLNTIVNENTPGFGDRVQKECEEMFAPDKKTNINTNFPLVSGATNSYNAYNSLLIEVRESFKKDLEILKKLKSITIFNKYNIKEAKNI